MIAVYYRIIFKSISITNKTLKMNVLTCVLACLHIFTNGELYAKTSDTEIVERLFSAAHFGKTSEVKALISKVKSVNVALDWGSRNQTSALIVAAESTAPNVEIIQMLLNAGADINFQSGDGYTALSSASRWLFGHPENLRALIDAGANPNLRTKHGDTATILATESGRPDFVQLLVNAGADANLENKDKCSAMEITQIRNEEASLENTPETVSHFAEVTRILKQKGAKTNTNRLFWCSLSWNFKKPIIRKKIIERAIREGAKIHSTLNNGKTPVMHALHHWHQDPDVLLEIVNILLSNKASVNQRDSEGKTALYIACEITENAKNAEAILTMLLKSGAKPNIGDIRGVTPLMLSARKFSPATIRLLISFGAKVNAEDNWGWTPLFYSWHACMTDSFQALRAAKANIHHIDKSGLNILDHGSACGEGAAVPQDELLRLGLKPSPSHSLLEFMPTNEPESADSKEQYVAFRRMIERTSKTYIKSDKNLILFHTNFPRVMEMLLQAGVNPNNMDHEGNTALMHYLESCVNNSHVNCSQDNLLLVIGLYAQSGYDFTLTNGEGKNTQSIARNSFQSKNFDENALQRLFSLYRISEQK